MQAAANPPSPAFARPGLLVEGDVVDAKGLTAYDDPEEWAVFSRPGTSTSITKGVWESQLVVRGMHCAACSLALEQTLLSVKGVISAKVSASSRRASVTWSADVTRPSEWLKAPKALGFELLPASDASASDSGRQEARLALWRWLVAGFCMMQVMMYAAPAYFSSPGDISPDIEKLLRWASWVLSLPVVFFSCSPFFRNALQSLRRRSINMDLPVAIGIAITFSISTAATFEPQGWWGKDVYFDSLTMFVFFLLTGRWLEQRLRQRTAGSLDLLMQRLPDSVERQLGNGQFERVAARRLKFGDSVRVLPGQAFPADGTIVSGDTHVDEALLTGESHHVARASGECVIAGSYNLSSPVIVRVEQSGGATRYAQIVALMEQASVEKPRLAMLADKAAGPFLWFVLLAATGAAAFWWGTDPARALMAAVAVLVVTCPCALSLATPSAMLSSAGLLARHGILVRRLQAIEALASIDTVVFDKTGTLTDARMGLRRVDARRSTTTQQEALELACLLARNSLHPVSRALVEAIDNDIARRDLSSTSRSRGARVTDVIEHPGQGLEGRLETDDTQPWAGHLFLGSAAFCGAEGLPADGLQVCLADSRGLIARFELGEIPRRDAVKAVAALRSRGLEMHVLSGDRQAAVSHLAEGLGITHAQGDCTPASKLDRLRLLQQQGRQVLMVGDGLNDGPVLAAAHVSVAIGSAVPLAQGRSDFVLPDGQLLMLPAMLVQARVTMRVVRQNLWWAATYNALCVPLALAGYVPAWLAGLGMAMSSLLVIANAARLAGRNGLPEITPINTLNGAF